jgi:hypothetical protein
MRAGALAHSLIGMMNMSTNSPLFVLVVALFVALFTRLRAVRIEGLSIGSVSLGAALFSFASKLPRRALPSSRPTLLPSRSSKCSRPRAERRAAKSRARTT